VLDVDDRQHHLMGAVVGGERLGATQRFGDGRKQVIGSRTVLPDPRWRPGRNTHEWESFALLPGKPAAWLRWHFSLEYARCDNQRKEKA
jgi:hypothetical protein